MYNTYHTFLIVAVYSGNCPEHIQNKIPSSSFHRIKNTDPSHYFLGGLEIQRCNQVGEALVYASTLILSFARILITFRDIFIKSKGFHNTLRYNKDQVLKALNTAFKTVGKRRRCDYSIFLVPLLTSGKVIVLIFQLNIVLKYSSSRSYLLLFRELI